MQKDIQLGCDKYDILISVNRTLMLIVHWVTNPIKFCFDLNKSKMIRLTYLSAFVHGVIEGNVIEYS